MQKGICYIDIYTKRYWHSPYLPVIVNHKSLVTIAPFVDHKHEISTLIMSHVHVHQLVGLHDETLPTDEG